MPLVKRADKINETRNAGGITTAAAVAVAKGKPERRDSEDRENCDCTKNGSATRQS